MIVDTSALLAIVFAEPGYEDVLRALSAADVAGMGAPSVTEATIVLTARLGAKAAGLIDRFLQELRIDVMPFGEPHVHIAVDAFRRYGKGRNKAGLNFGDCMAYAIAKVAGAALLYVGDDFRYTDIQAALPAG